MHTKELEEQLFKQRENNQIHSDYNDEFTVYEMIINGEVDKLKKYTFTLDAEDKGTLSDDPVRNLRYHLIIAIAIISRMCIERGMDKEVAFSMSDIYIRKCDVCNTKEGIIKLHRDSIIDFAQRMKNEAKKGLYSRHVVEACEFINTHLNGKLSVNIIAAHINISPNYLSGIFKSETGTAISEYIRSAKLQEAERMLRFTDYSEADISEYLAFASCSHFINTFRKHIGVTPGQYRKVNFRKNFKSE
ncbi:MAG: helix-turn-helix domain-containing protein [Oscillospiraceae bacterium]|nr:helix-turn-helix domain-containing protein [Oscillospiraceae bacterium]MBQ9982245.1 helix-turn-helix domain-containing protein [Oscillospiraceae bacterium]